MQIPSSEVKVLKTDFENLLLGDNWLEMLLCGDFYGFEKLLHQRVYSLYDKLCESFVGLVGSSGEFKAVQEEKAREEYLRKLEVRPAAVRLRTGTVIKHDSLYAKEVPEGYAGERHLSRLIWGTGCSSSPMCKSLSCLHSVLCPSFQVSKSLLDYQGIGVNYEKLRQVSLGLAEECMSERASVQLGRGETLAGKRVVVAMDGGRTRTRDYGDGPAGRAEKFKTPWREPKMFVITVYDAEGKEDKECKPIYDGTFGDDETFALLESYLRNLEVEKALDVQFLADGATWIWNRAKDMLLGLGVAEDNILETLDYYHAIEHVNDMEEYFDKDKRESHWGRLKDALWQGDFKEMTRLVTEGIKGVDLDSFTPYKYFKNRRDKIDYQYLRKEGRPCGSGIIESAIRRIINLRFKGASSFWYPENVEKLIFMRGVALAGRWDIMMNNKFT